MQQILIHYRIQDLATFRAALDLRADARGLAGVSLLQVWRYADDRAAALCLYQLHDRARAEDWLKGEIALHGASDPRFLVTA